MHQESYTPLRRKSPGVAFLLTFFFGPFGLLYANVKASLLILSFGFLSLIGLIVSSIKGYESLAIFSFTALLGYYLLGWLASIVIALISVKEHNEKIRMQRDSEFTFVESGS